jgi:hypothetical protein
MSAAQFDGRGIDPPYPTDEDQAVLDERERCALIAETLEFRLLVVEWVNLSKKQISERIAHDIAKAIREQ